MKNIVLLIFSLILSLVICELFLSILGRYNDAVNPTYSTDLIWERPKSTTEFRKHPDLGFLIPINFDRSGVRNDGPIETENKKNIYAFFGDSFTENRRVQSEFSFTEILDHLLRDASVYASVVNYGVDGYGLDQQYLRYKKLSNHKIDRVFYVFCSNDFRNLYETELIDFSKDNDIIILKPKRNLAIDVLGRLRITYLILESYYKLKGIMNSDSSSSKAYDAKLSKEYKDRSRNNLVKAYSRRFHDSYADSMLQALLSKSYDEKGDIRALRNKFRVLLQKWNSELESKGIRFDIIVLPWDTDDLAAKNLFGDLPLNVLYLRDFVDDVEFDEYRFKNNDHWNEKGNLFAARTIYRYLGYGLATDDPTIRKIGSRIEDLYAGRLAGVSTKNQKSDDRPHSPDRSDQIEKNLRAAGYVSWEEIEFNAGWVMWEVANAKKEGDDREFDLKLAPETFEIIVEREDD